MFWHPRLDHTQGWGQIFIIQCLNHNSCSSFFSVWLLAASFGLCRLLLFILKLVVAGCNSSCGLHQLTWGKPEKRFCIFINFSALPTEIDSRTPQTRKPYAPILSEHNQLHNLASVALDPCLEFYFIHSRGCGLPHAACRLPLASCCLPLSTCHSRLQCMAHAPFWKRSVAGRCPSRLCNKIEINF